MRHRALWLTVLLGASLLPAGGRAADALAAATAEVRATEIAFAHTMAARDHAAFLRFVARDAVFLGERTVLRGRDAIGAGWQRYFDAPDAPFSWRPERVEVTLDGRLAFSTGPVFDRNGTHIGTYHSTWRRERDGRWRIVIDAGDPACNCRPAAQGSSE